MHADGDGVVVCSVGNSVGHIGLAYQSAVEVDFQVRAVINDRHMVVGLVARPHISDRVEAWRPTRRIDAGADLEPFVVLGKVAPDIPRLVGPSLPLPHLNSIAEVGFAPKHVGRSRGAAGNGAQIADINDASATVAAQGASAHFAVRRPGCVAVEGAVMAVEGVGSWPSGIIERPVSDHPVRA